MHTWREGGGVTQELRQSEQFARRGSGITLAHAQRHRGKQATDSDLSERA